MIHIKKASTRRFWTYPKREKQIKKHTVYLCPLLILEQGFQTQI